MAVFYLTQQTTEKEIVPGNTYIFSGLAGNYSVRVDRVLSVVQLSETSRQVKVRGLKSLLQQMSLFAPAKDDLCNSTHICSVCGRCHSEGCRYAVAYCYAR